MKFDNHILVIISIVSLFFIILVDGLDSSSSLLNGDDIYDEVKMAFRTNLDGAKDKFGPISSFDLDDFEEARDAFGPIPSFDEATEALGPSASNVLRKAKDALGPISPSALDDAKEALGPASSKAKEALDEAKKALGPASSNAKEAMSPASDKAKEALEEAKGAMGPASDKAKEALGPSSSNVIDKAREKFDSFTSWITQSKEDASSEAQKESPQAPSPSAFDPYGILDGAKQNFDSLLDSITQQKEQISPSLMEEAKSGPVSSVDIDQAKEAPPPVSLSSLDEAKDLSDQAQKKMGPSPASSPAPLLSEGSITSLIIQNREEVSSDPPSISVKSRKELSPISSSNEDASSPSPLSASAPVLPSSFKEAIHAAKEKISSISSYFSQNKVQTSPESDIKLHSDSVYFDHDVALAIESMIKQAQSNSQLAIDEAKTLLSDPIDSPDAGKCVQKCMANYESCSQKLNRAMEDLRARNVELFTDDIGAAEGEIYACQKCFQENTKTQSPFSDLEEATIKATRECLNVLDHSG
ncbi:hypothetical protein L1987_03675 [Smallanthus sonchifolius]|uniref:Uncharacterized protein n=1 Tax=Smallanthus sonchifolius TaxID=185202 RepID=A0ACB9KBC1_9ASTR|nr:hypothetical protein L1987_03675 [Smallanthus sonchifolius]